MRLNKAATAKLFERVCREKLEVPVTEATFVSGNLDFCIYNENYLRWILSISQMINNVLGTNLEVEWTASEDSDPRFGSSWCSYRIGIRDKESIKRLHEYLQEQV